MRLLRPKPERGRGEKKFFRHRSQLDFASLNNRLYDKMGLPQGSPLSPLLANIMLDDFDSDLEHAGLRLVRFADDFMVLTRTEKAAVAAREVVVAALAEKDLKINKAKTRVRSFAPGFRYLGYLFVNSFVLDMGEKRTDMTYIVCYDVSDDKVRDRIAKVLLKYGNRVQYSVFEVMLRSQTELQTLSEKLRAVADEETDIRLYRLCENCRRAAHDLEGKPIVEMPAVVII